MKFAVESWAPEYGSSVDDAVEESQADIDPAIEQSLDVWAPVDRSVAATRFDDLLFVDGVQRREAAVWVRDGDGLDRQGLCVSVGAGAVRCSDRADIVVAQVERYLFSSAEIAEPIVTRHGTFHLRFAEERAEKQSEQLNAVMGELEGRAAQAAGSADVVVVDGPLKVSQYTGDFVGYVKTHHTSYGKGEVGTVVRSVAQSLGAEQRTPIFAILGRRPRWSWYMRLPCDPVHGLAGVVRFEVGTSRSVTDVVDLADRLAATLPRFASVPHKDARAPQNLYPIAGLERELRRRLGDQALMHRTLRAVAADSR